MNSRRNFIKNSLLGASVVLLPGSMFLKATRKLSKVLIIGDSISIGYYPFVKEMMKEVATVMRPFKDNGSPENCQGTTNGVVNIDRWIGNTKWDVIHFNFGLHDIKHVNAVTGKNSKNPEDPHQASPEQYEKNIREIVGKLKATGAKLIFATTTPYPDAGLNPLRKPGMYKKYNEIAQEIMKQNGIEVNDLCAFVLPRMEELQRPENVHFTEKGSKALAEQVAGEISKVL
jgi:lysophospholipase L1-like esterase